MRWMTRDPEVLNVTDAYDDNFSVIAAVYAHSLVVITGISVIKQPSADWMNRSE